MTERVQTVIADVLAFTAAVLHSNTDPAIMDESALDDVIVAPAEADPEDLAIAAVALVIILVRDLAAHRGELPEEVLQDFALRAAQHQPPADL